MRTLIAALLIAAPALAETAMAETVTAETVILEETAQYEARIAFAPEAAAWPALDERLRDDAAAVLTEFKAWAAANDTPHPYTLNVDHVVAYDDGRYLNLLRVVDYYTGGAHGNRGFTGMIWDGLKGQAIGLDALILPEGVEAIGIQLRADIADQLYDGEVSSFWRDAVRDATQPDALTTFTLGADDDGAVRAIDFHFAPYEVAAWSEGAPTIRIPVALVADWLTPDGAALLTP